MGSNPANLDSDYNYETDTDGSCQLVKGLAPPDHSQVCRDDPKRVKYYVPTGYRRIPLSECVGGHELAEYDAVERICPGHKQEYLESRPGLSGFWLFIVAVVLPVGVASAVGYWVWRNWDGKFGRIRLGGDSSGTQQPWIAYPIMVVSAVVAVLAAIPLVVGSLWRSVSGLFGGGKRYTTRSSFARGRGDYAVVDPDEDELLGDDEDEET